MEVLRQAKVMVTARMIWPTPAEIMARDLRQGNAAIVGDLEQSARLCAHENRNDINYRHQNAGQYAGAQHVNGNRVVIVNAYARMTSMTTMPKARPAMASMVP